MDVDVKDLVKGILGAVAFFGILYLPLDGNLKNLILGILCGFIFLIYIFRARTLAERAKLLRVFIISLPTLFLLMILALNYIYQWSIKGVYIWVGYALFTSIALTFSARLKV